MKKGDIVIGKVIRTSFPNKGEVLLLSIGENPDLEEQIRSDPGSFSSENTLSSSEEPQEVFYVKNALVGQIIKCRINKKKHGDCSGQILETLVNSELEVIPDCPHFIDCGGCSYRTLPYEEQLKLKEKQVSDLLKPVLSKEGIEFETIYEGINPSPVTEGYRNKMEFSFGDEFKDGPLSVGLHKRNSTYDIVPVTECRIVDEDYRKILKFTLEFFREKNLPYFHKVKHSGYLRHLLVRKSRKYGEILIALITTSKESYITQCLDSDNSSFGRPENTDIAKVLNEYKEGLLHLSLDGSVKGIIHTLNDSVADAVIDEGSEVLYGDEFIREELLGLKFNISEFSFFQTNSAGAEVLYGKVREFLLGDGENENNRSSVIYDLYSGTGTIAQLLAPVASRVVGVEIVEEAVEAARQNAKLNGLDNCGFIAGDVLKVLDDLTEKPDYIILDPPRDGIHPKALPKILNYGVERMVYVSCKPTSLARDLEVFMANGYVPKRICTVDMFPGTNHVETVCKLERK